MFDKTKKLGFGLMRLPLADQADTTKIDYGAVCEMVDRYMDAGFHYFDTAAPYHGGGNSEIAFRECVAKRFPRDSYTITDKLTFSLVKKAEELEGFFEEQCKRCGVDYFDYYLLHAMNQDYLKLAEKIGAFDFVAEKKKEGKIRHIGFSFHDKPQVLDAILTRHPEMECVQLQINYADWEDPDVQAKECYEVCKKYQKPVIVMEPVKGGLLANVPEEVEQMLKGADPVQSQASWAIRYAASLKQVVMVLSGMSNLGQMEDNLSFMGDFKPLSKDEMQMMDKAAGMIRSKASIACTKCRYCVDGCPQKIAIPEYFKLVNDISRFGDVQLTRAKASYQNYIDKQGKGKASDCIRCRQCEQHCPQHLPIIKHLEEAAKVLEG